MNTKYSRKRGISTVLTTIIILVASVVLGSGVVLYGTSLFQGGTQTEAISVQGTKLWVNATDTNGVAWGAVGIRNSGDKIVSVDKVSVRGTDVPYSQWYADTDQTRVSATVFQSAYTHGTTTSAGMMKDTASMTGTACAGSVELSQDFDGAGTTLDRVCLDQQSGPVSLSPGERAIIYFHLNNGVLSSLDSGAQTSLNVFAGKVGAPQSITVANP